MDRYTKYDEYKNADIIGIDSEDLQINLEYKDFNKVTNSLNRLAAYEDTGLTPEKITGLKDYKIRYLELEERYKESLKEADMLESENKKLSEKQVPKRATIGPIPGYEHYTSMLLYTCPVCHSVLGDNGSGYCRFCGQKLKGDSE